MGVTRRVGESLFQVEGPKTEKAPSSDSLDVLVQSEHQSCVEFYWAATIDRQVRRVPTWKSACVFVCENYIDKLCDDGRFLADEDFWEG